jgi:hypothetical protein
MVKSKKGNNRKRRRSRSKSRRVGNKKFLIHLEKKRTKAKKKLVNISCSIRTAKLRRNKCLRGKKEMMRLTKRLCRLRRERTRLQSTLKKLHVKNNKCF